MKSLERYLAALPDGIASFPEFKAKGSLFTELIKRDLVARDDFDKLPPEVSRHFHSPPPVSALYPETELVAVMLAHLDLVFDGDEEAFVDLFYQLSKDLYARPFYRFFMYVSSPERLTRAVHSRWGSTHKGSVVENAMFSSNDGEFDILLPEALYPDIALRTMEPAIKAALECTRANNVVVTVTRTSPTRVHLTGRWD